MPKALIVANWKMHKTATEAAAFVQALQQYPQPEDRTMIICPPFTILGVLRNQGVPYGAQNMHWEEKGAFTGEVSASMLVDQGCSYVIIGHSERREHFGETDGTVAKKVDAALANNLMPIVCVRSVEEVTPDLVGKEIAIAYEPVWAIGTGKAATPEQAQEVHAQIRKLVGPDVSILYGGSVTADNAGSLMAQPDVNGLLVGGASLDADQFWKIVNY